jgi:hypothetical protein
MANDAAQRPMSKCGVERDQPRGICFGAFPVEPILVSKMGEGRRRAGTDAVWIQTTVSKAREQNHHWNDLQRGTIEARRV